MQPNKRKGSDSSKLEIGKLIYGFTSLKKKNNNNNIRHLPACIRCLFFLLISPTALKMGTSALQHTQSHRLRLKRGHLSQYLARWDGAAARQLTENLLATSARGVTPGFERRKMEEVRSRGRSAALFFIALIESVPPPDAPHPHSSFTVSAVLRCSPCTSGRVNELDCSCAPSGEVNADAADSHSTAKLLGDANFF